MTTYVGGVSELYQGDLDLGRRVVQRLELDDLGAGVRVEDLHYGAVAVAQRLQDVAPDTVVLVGAVERGRPPGSIHRDRRRPVALPPAELQLAIGDAVTGYVGIDLLLDVAAGLGALPDRVVTIEVEPVRVAPSDRLSPEVRDALDPVVARVRDEVARSPLYVVVEELSLRTADGHLDAAPAVDTLVALLAELRRVDVDGRWGATFPLRDALRADLAAGRTSEGMDHADWGLVWGLIEELGRLEQADASTLGDQSSASGSS